MADFSTNETLNTYFELDDLPTVEQMQSFIKSKLGILIASGDLPAAASTNLGHKYLIGTTLYTCILTDTTYSWQAQVWGGGVSAYTDLSAKPKINTVELNGDKTALQLGLLPTATTGMTAATTLGVDNIFYTKAGTTWYYVPFSLVQSLILSGSVPIFLSGTAVTGTSSGVIVTVAGSKINDMYINTTTGNLYQCVDVNTWDFICSLVPTKTEMFFGTEVTGTGTDIAAIVEGSKAGDYYKNTDTSFYYQATAANVWDYRGSDRGAAGDDGKGIESIIRTSGSGNPGTTDVYTITYTDSTTSTFNVYNGADGTNVLSAGIVTSLTSINMVYCEVEGVTKKITLANLKSSLAAIE